MPPKQKAAAKTSSTRASRAKTTAEAAEVAQPDIIPIDPAILKSDKPDPVTPVPKARGRKPSKKLASAAPEDDDPDDDETPGGKKFMWLDPLVDALIAIVLEHVRANHRSNNGFKDAIWEEICAEVQESGCARAGEVTVKRCRDKIDNVSSTSPISRYLLSAQRALADNRSTDEKKVQRLEYPQAAIWVVI